MGAGGDEVVEIESLEKGLLTPNKEITDVEEDPISAVHYLVSTSSDDRRMLV
ncbi:hypothetical protein NC653_015172 [Populus alba x Populus x berolinensis]|uniref:Uncharacterized protein n=1 Tax=Populus alba x Populus x berolinensis TaxID=444605 RepID=A0AAD6QJZ3_9ROSI|nr:hypothetical protein NC653_015172 [Populus alba x Populus x berolinensis]